MSIKTKSLEERVAELEKEVVLMKTLVSQLVSEGEKKTEETKVVSLSERKAGRKLKSKARQDVPRMHRAVSAMKKEVGDIRVFKPKFFRVSPRLAKTEKLEDQEVVAEFMKQAVVKLKIGMVCAEPDLKALRSTVKQTGSSYEDRVDAFKTLVNKFAKDSEWPAYACHLLNDHHPQLQLLFDYTTAGAPMAEAKGSQDHLMFKTTPLPKARHIKKNGKVITTIICHVCSSIEEKVDSRPIHSKRCDKCIEEGHKVSFLTLEQMIAYRQDLHNKADEDLFSWEKRFVDGSPRASNVVDEFTQMLVSKGLCVEIANYMHYYWPDSTPKGRGHKKFYARLVEAFHQAFIPHKISVNDIGGRVVQNSAPVIHDLMDIMTLGELDLNRVRLAPKYEADEVTFLAQYPGWRASDRQTVFNVSPSTFKCLEYIGGGDDAYDVLSALRTGQQCRAQSLEGYLAELFS